MALNDCSLPQWNWTHGGRPELRPLSEPGRLGSVAIRARSLEVYVVTSAPSRVVSKVTLIVRVADCPPWNRSSGAFLPFAWGACHELDLLMVSSDGLNRNST